MATMGRSVIYREWSRRSLREGSVWGEIWRSWGNRLSGILGKGFPRRENSQCQDGGVEPVRPVCEEHQGWLWGWKSMTEGRRWGLRGRWRPRRCSLVGCCWDFGIFPELNGLEVLSRDVTPSDWSSKRVALAVMLRVDCSGPEWEAVRRVPWQCS